MAAVSTEVSGGRQGSAATWRKQVMVGDLPPDFLRIMITPQQAQCAQDAHTARMLPYCRLRIGHAVFETPTSYNGAKNPRWQKSVQCYLPQAVDTIHLEIFDERAFAVDDRIAWTDIVISPRMLDGTMTDTIDDWFPLSGKQGEEKEGSINVVISFVKGSQPMMPWAPAQLQPMVMVPGPVQPPHGVPASAIPPS